MMVALAWAGVSVTATLVDSGTENIEVEAFLYAETLGAIYHRDRTLPIQLIAFWNSLRSATDEQE